MSGEDRPTVSPVLQSPSELSPHHLYVDESARRARANSDPVVHHTLPEIMVTGEDGSDWLTGEDDELGLLIPPAPRKRANTCPDDLFQLRKGRPPTPPPSDIGKGPPGKRYSFNFSPKDLNGISFAHHKLSKVAEAARQCEEEEEEEESASPSAFHSSYQTSLTAASPNCRRHSHTAVYDSRTGHTSAFTVTRHGKSLGNAFQGLTISEKQGISSLRGTTKSDKSESDAKDNCKNVDVSKCSSKSHHSKDSKHDSATLQAC